MAATKNAVTQTVSYFYNPDDSLNYLTDPTGRTDVTYYADGRVKDVLTTLNGLPNVQKLTYAYYANGSRKSLIWAQGIGGNYSQVAQWQYEYNGKGQLVKVKAQFLGMAGNTWQETIYSYDGEGKLLSQANANGTITSYAYTGQQGWTSSINHSKVGVGAFSDAFNLTYDGGANTVGILTGVAESGTDGSSTTTYAYDALDRLTSETRTGANAYPTATYTVDLAGNRTNRTQNGVSVSLGYDDANKYAAAGLPAGYEAVYDADGNLTRWVPGTGQAGYQNTYDMWGHLSSVVLVNQSAPGGEVTTSYQYDALGRRVVQQNGVETGGRKYFVFNGTTLIGEIHCLWDGSSPKVKRAYTWGAAGLVSKWSSSDGVSGSRRIGYNGEAATKHATVNLTL